MLGAWAATLARNAKAFIQDRTAGVQIWFAGSLIVVVGLAGFAVDGSYFYVMRNQLQIAADSAALAGAVHLDDVTKMRTEAITYANMNMPNDSHILANADVQRGHWDHDAKTFTVDGTPLNAVQVVTRKTAANGNSADTFFARIFGVEEVEIDASAVAAFETNQEWDVVIVQDVTSSFSAEIASARDANHALLECIRERVSGQSLIGMVLFTGVSTSYRELEEMEESYENMGSAIDALNPCGYEGMPECSGTHVGIGIEQANALFAARASDPDLGRAMVILGDGLPNAKGPNAGQTNEDLRNHAFQQADIADANGISVYTVFYDEDNNDTSAAFFEDLVRGEGKALRTPDPLELPELFADLCAEVPPRLVQ